MKNGKLVPLGPGPISDFADFLGRPTFSQCRPNFSPCCRTNSSLPKACRNGWRRAEPIRVFLHLPDPASRPTTPLRHAFSRTPNRATPTALSPDLEYAKSRWATRNPLDLQPFPPVPDSIQ